MLCCPSSEEVPRFTSLGSVWPSCGSCRGPGAHPGCQSWSSSSESAGALSPRLRAGRLVSMVWLWIRHGAGEGEGGRLRTVSGVWPREGLLDCPGAFRTRSVG